ncbi:penicillin-insensitive murein endopeptidase [Sandaracinus amylolyticus]|uniref:penicillin-insensitive murein endopeptidase n=1 Tax=Sandaracinus amylolyticus TaxID=927083 RepID=UPI00069F3497|nr:penicillin-insensitive murein endopeptidase [Sandaracinus amylolyticus]
MNNVSSTPRGSSIAAVATATSLSLVLIVAGAGRSDAQLADASSATPRTSSASSVTTAPRPTDPLSASPSQSTSIGGPSSGRVEGAIALPSTAPGLRSNPLRPNPDAIYGTVELVRALVRAAAVVHAEIPGADLVINDIGLPNGGPIPHHGSHQAGRDVDVLFYYLDADGAPFAAKGIPVDPRGRGWDFADLADPRDDVRVRLDVPRTWRFVQALVQDDLDGQGALVQRVFVAEHVRTMLLEHAERARAPRAVRDRFADLTCQPSHPHDDHLHIRFFCSTEDLQNGCEDGGPMYPWRRQQLREAQVDPVRARARARTREDRGRTTSQREAATRAGEMHRRVRAFLDERATWSVQPHPGRPFCR